MAAVSQQSPHDPFRMPAAHNDVSWEHEVVPTLRKRESIVLVRSQSDRRVRRIEASGGAGRRVLRLLARADARWLLGHGRTGSRICLSRTSPQQAGAHTPCRLPPPLSALIPCLLLHPASPATLHFGSFFSLASHRVPRHVVPHPRSLGAQGQ